MNTIALMKKVAQVAPAKYEFIIKTSGEVRNSPFRDEIVGRLDSLIKRASFTAAAAGIGATVATGIAYSLAGDMYDSIKRGVTKSQHYRGMMNDNPDLADMPAKEVQRAFSSLHRFNPEFASDPTVAGSFVRRQVKLEEFDIKGLTELVGARKNLTDIKKLPMPSRVPWESDNERKLREAQTAHFQSSSEKARMEMGSMPADQLRRDVQNSLTVKQLQKLEKDIANMPDDQAHKAMQSALHKVQADKGTLDMAHAKDLHDAHLTKVKADAADAAYANKMTNALRFLQAAEKANELRGTVSPRNFDQLRRDVLKYGKYPVKP